MRPLARILVDEAHRQAWSTRPRAARRINPVHPSDASYHRAARAAVDAGFALDVHRAGPLDAAALADCDVLVLPHASQDAWEHTTGRGSPMLTDTELDAIEQHVRDGGGLVVLAETEQAKYGNNFGELTRRFGIAIDSTTVVDASRCAGDVATWVLADRCTDTRGDLAAGVSQACFYRAGSLHAAESTGALVEVRARSSATADPARAALLMTSTAPTGGRAVVVADSDIFGDDSITEFDHLQLWLNLVTWASGGRNARTPERTAAWTDGDPSWLGLLESIERLHDLQQEDGSVADRGHDAAARLVAEMSARIDSLRPRFPHQADQLTATLADLARWRDSGFGPPDFLDSLMLFHPEAGRADGVEHLAVFPMYTQNGSSARRVEAVIARTYWPRWLAEQERVFDNPAFVPVQFVGYTSGYDTHSAVLFPETVGTREPAEFSWGAIFCDREAARFRAVARSAAAAVDLPLPPDVEILVDDQQLAQDTFALWDLLHDRTHSRGALPFDPFMIKRRAPYWMYALEELRCDLTAFRDSLRSTRAWVGSSATRSSSIGSSGSASPVRGFATTTRWPVRSCSPGCTAVGPFNGRTTASPSTGVLSPTR